MVPVLFATAFMRTLRKQLAAIVLLVTISLVVEIANSMMARSNQSNVVIFYGYTIVEFVLISWFYSKFIHSALLLAMLAGRRRACD